MNSVMITGDAMGKPLIESLDDPGADHDLSSLLAVVSSAALFSAPVKDQFFAHLPNLVITDAIGSSEGGNNGMTVVTAGNTAMKSGPTVHLLGQTVVFDENLELVEPGSGVIGKIARSGDIPLGYYNDPKKTAEVFIEVRGTRYVMPGDYATVEADGSITLLGRGSIVINSGGEKIFPEEVESAVRSHPDVMDAIVCGAPDERWGQTVAAIVQPRVGHEAPSLESIQEHCRDVHRGLQAAAPPVRRRRGRALAVGQARLHVGGRHRERGRRGVGRDRGAALSPSTSSWSSPPPARAKGPSKDESTRPEGARYGSPIAEGGTLVSGVVVTILAGLGLLLPAAGVVTAMTDGPAAAASAAPTPSPTPSPHVDAGTSWTVYHGNPLGTGVDTSGVTFSPPNPAWTSPALDGQVYGEPLEATGASTWQRRTTRSTRWRRTQATSCGRATWEHRSLRPHSRAVTSRPRWASPARPSSTWREERSSSSPTC